MVQISGINFSTKKNLIMKKYMIAVAAFDK